jgi:hypothetical protein
VELDEMIDALVARLGENDEIVEAELDEETLALARRLLEESAR